jgi:hypothetical protein
MKNKIHKVTTLLALVICQSSCDSKSKSDNLTTKLATEILNASLIYPHQPFEKEKFSVHGVRSEVSIEGYVIADARSYIDKKKYTAYFLSYNDGRWVFHHLEEAAEHPGAYEYDPKYPPTKDTYGQSTYW